MPLIDLIDTSVTITRDKMYSWPFYLTLSAAIALFLWLMLGFGTYDPANPEISFIMGGGIGLGIGLALVTFWLKGSENIGQLHAIIYRNRHLHDLDDITVPQSILLTISSTREDVYDYESTYTTKWQHGLYGPLNKENGTFSIGQLTNSGPYRGYGCITISLPGSFGHCIVDAHKDSAKTRQDDRFSLKHRLASKYHFQLEGDFANKFSVYAKDAEQMRALMYVLTPDVMQLILDCPAAIDIEIVDNLLIIAWPEPALSARRKNWQALIEQASKITNEIGAELYDRIERYLNTANDIKPLTDKHMQLTVTGSALGKLNSRQSSWHNFIYNPFVLIIGSVIFVSLALIIVTVALGYQPPRQ